MKKTTNNEPIISNFVPKKEINVGFSVSSKKDIAKEK